MYKVCALIMFFFFSILIGCSGNRHGLDFQDQNPQEYVKWLWAHLAQNEWEILYDVPRAEGRWNIEGHDQVYRLNTNDLSVSIDDLLPHVIVVEVTPINGSDSAYQVHLDEVGQRMVLDSKVEVSQHLRWWITHDAYFGFIEKEGVYYLSEIK